MTATRRHTGNLRVNGGAGRGWGVRHAFAALLIVSAALFFPGCQATLFYTQFVPRIETAAQRYYDLLSEQKDTHLYRRIESQLHALGASAREREAERAIAEVTRNFRFEFMLTPAQAAHELMQKLAEIPGAISASGAAGEQLRADLLELEILYTDPYRELSADLEDLPLYLQPVGGWIADRSGYRQIVTVNRALYLSRTGETGKARVLLSELLASTSDPQWIGLGNYLLGRLQFELLQGSSESEVRGRAVNYLRQSLIADPEPDLAQLFLDYLLSMNEGTSVLEVGAGASSEPSEGEGTDNSPADREF